MTVQAYVVESHAVSESVSFVVIGPDSVHWKDQSETVQRGDRRDLRAVLRGPANWPIRIPPGGCVVETLSGERIVAASFNSTDRGIEATHPAIGQRQWDRTDVAALRFGPLSGSPIDAGPPFVTLANGDALVGAVTLLEDSVVVNTRLGVVSAPLERVAEIRFQLSRPPPSDARAILADGSLVAAQDIEGAIGPVGDAILTLLDGRRIRLAQGSVVGWLEAGVTLQPFQSPVIQPGARTPVVHLDPGERGAFIGEVSAPEPRWADARATLWSGEGPLWFEQLTSAAPRGEFAMPLPDSPVTFHVTPGRNGAPNAIARLRGLIVTWPEGPDEDTAPTGVDSQPAIAK